MKTFSTYLEEQVTASDAKKIQSSLEQTAKEFDHDTDKSSILWVAKQISSGKDVQKKVYRMDTEVRDEVFTAIEKAVGEKKALAITGLKKIN